MVYKNFDEFWGNGLEYSKHRGHHYDDVRYGWRECEQNITRKFAHWTKDNAPLENCKGWVAEYYCINRGIIEGKGITFISDNEPTLNEAMTKLNEIINEPNWEIVIKSIEFQGN